MSITIEFEDFIRYYDGRFPVNYTPAALTQKLPSHLLHRDEQFEWILDSMITFFEKLGSRSDVVASRIMHFQLLHFITICSVLLREQSLLYIH